ncbi:MAG: alanine--tRNA ligase [Nitrospinales bacterium]
MTGNKNHLELTGDEIRSLFIDFYRKRGHTVTPSDSLVPANDPTLLFTNAGMVQFKSVFLGEETRDYSTAVSSQKCVRAGGKHNDLEMVGRTARHHTFFEMLGNFSFGDYFKNEAIASAWEFLTKTIGLPEEKLYASVFQDDDEAYNIWRDEIKLSEDRIVRLGEEDNFWSMGSVGPCGPCSEIYIDQGEAIGCGKQTCAVGCDCDRFLEIWNLVFMQYDRDEKGTLSPLPKPCIDTGMGLERLTAVCQGKFTNYDCDLLAGLISEICKVTKTKYKESADTDVSINVLSDHARATTFLISDGVLPSNEGRGYVLRRIMRRGLRHGKLLGQKEKYFYKITDSVIDQFKNVYPELEKNRAFIKNVVTNEEESFTNTLTFGLQRLNEIIERLKKEKNDVIPGDEIFKLYDTYGFPMDLVEETARDIGFTTDMDGYNKAMQQQKEMAMASWKGSGEKEVSPIFNQLTSSLGATKFKGYNSTQGDGKILAIIVDGKEIKSAKKDDIVDLLLDQTPFYGESGGQMGDAGMAHTDKARLEIINATKPVSGLIVHRAKILEGQLEVSDSLSLEVDEDRRNSTALNHSATHLLHAALKEVLGDHIKQAGSLVAHDRLRFDYTHFSPLSDREKLRIESLVNEKVRENIQVDTEEMPIDEALKGGATALFGEKYGEAVRVVSVPEFSKELCGGTHVKATGDIGFFKIVHEGGIASGVRRIEALTGPDGFDKIQKEFQSLTSLRSLLKAQPDEEVNRLQKLLDKNREMEKEIATLKEKLVSGKKSDGLKTEVQKIGNTSLLVEKLEGVDPKLMRSYIDNAKNQMQSGIVVAGATENGKVFLAVGVTKDLIDKYHAGNIIGKLAEIVGGKGGGRPDMAQAGGTKPELLDQALESVSNIIQN